MAKFIGKAISVALLFVVSLSTALAAPNQDTLKVKVKLPSSGVDQVNAITTGGRVFRGTRVGRSVTITIPKSYINRTSFYATNGGRLVGPVYGMKGSKGLLYLVKNPTNPAGQKLKVLSLKIAAPTDGENFAKFATVPKGKIFSATPSYTPSLTPAFGLNTPSGISAKQTVKAEGIIGDSDRDGVVDSLDVDADGDGINNVADASTDLVQSGMTKLSGEGVDIPFTALFLSMPETVNWHILGSLDRSIIDSVIGGENIFSIAFFFSLPPGETTGITGGHVVCGSALSYCRPTDGDGTGTGIYSGFSEGDSSLIGQLWSNITTDGNEYSLESFSVGGSSEPVYAASIQPRVGTSAFRPGDNYRVDFTSATGAVVTSKSLTLPPYFLTVPAIRAFNTTSNDSSGDVLVDYSDNSGPGMNSGNPIEVNDSGEFAGKLRLHVSRLQRLTVAGESGDYRDYGHLNYGVIIDNNSAEYSCGGLYSEISSTLTEVPSVGSGGSYRSSDGAILWPLVDSADDYQPSNDADEVTVGNNTISFTVDLGACRVRNGLAPGIYNVSLTAAGVDTGHGANRAAQRFAVSIP